MRSAAILGMHFWTNDFLDVARAPIRQMSALANAERLLLVVALVALFVLSPVIGSLGSVIAVVASMVLAALALRQGVGSESPIFTLDLQLLTAAFVILAVTFSLTADDWTDVRYAANFLALPLAAALRFQYARFLSPRATFLFWLCLAGAVASALVAFYAVGFRGLARAEGFFGGSNLLPRTAIVLGFAAIGGVFLVKSRMRLLFYLGPACATIATYYSGSRGAALAIPILAVLAAAFLALRSDTRRHVAWAAAAMVVAVAAAPLMVDTDRLLARFMDLPAVLGTVLATGTSQDINTYVRLEMIHAAVEAFQSSPWIGYGWANLPEAAQPIIIGHLVLGGPNDPGFQFHNDVANFAVAGGIAGVVAWMLILCAPTVGALSSSRDERFHVRLYLGLMLALAYLTFGLTDMTLGYDLPTTLFAFTAAIVGAISSKVGGRPASYVGPRPL